MAKKTNLQKIKEIGILLYDCIPIKDIGMGFTNHSYVDSLHYVDQNNNIKKMSTKEDFDTVRNRYIDMINESDLSGVHNLVRNPYKLLWFKLCKDYLSGEDFSKYWIYCWVSQENPNQDINVSRRECISYFKKALNSQYPIMDEEELSYYNSLPDEVEIYRGVGVGREPYGLSWTDDIDTATWFKKRFDRDKTKGYLLKAKVPKKYILAYLNSRGEKELVVDVYKIKPLIHHIENSPESFIFSQNDIIYI